MYSKFEVFCDDAAGIVTTKLRNCTAGCGECSADWWPSGQWEHPIASWMDYEEEGQCLDVDILPPYDPEFNITAMSYRCVNDTEGAAAIYNDIFVANSCISDAEDPAAAQDAGKEIVLGTVLYESHPVVYFDEAENEWVGYDIDVADLLVAEAAKDGYNLKFDIDYDNVLTDDNSADVDSGLDYLASDCKESGEGKCYDFILGSFRRTKERQTEVIFTPPQFVAFLEPIVKSGSGIASLEDVVERNGTLCSTETDLDYSGFSVELDAPPEVSTVETCETPEDCLEMVMTGQCTLYLSYLVKSRTLVAQDEKYTDLETVDKVIPKQDGSEGYNWISFPMSPNLPAGTTVLLSQWMHKLYESGALGDLQTEYFGNSQDYSNYFPREINLTAGVYGNKPQAYQNESGDWVGIVFDSADLLTQTAKKDGVKLNIEVDTLEEGIVSDYPGELGTPTGSLAFVSPDCEVNSTHVCFDVMLGAWSISPLRQALVTFTPPYMESYITTIRRPSGAYDTVEKVNAGGGKVCLWAGSYVEDAVTDMVQNPVECPTQDVCYEMVKAGDCDMTVDDHASAVAREAQDPEGLFVTGEVVPGTIDYLAFPMKSTLDPATQVALTFWMHEYTSALDLTTVGAEYLTGEVKDDTTPESESQAGASSGAFVSRMNCAGLIFGISTLLLG